VIGGQRSSLLAFAGGRGESSGE